MEKEGVKQGGTESAKQTNVTPSKGGQRGGFHIPEHGGVLKLGNRHAPNGQGTRPLGGVLILRSSRVNSFESFSNPLSLPPMVVSPAKAEVETFLASCLSNR